MIFRVVTFAAAGLISGTLGFYVIDRDPPTVLLRTEVMFKPVRPGDDLRIKYHVTRFRSCEALIDRTLFDADSVRVVLDDLAFSGAPGPLGESSYVAVIPLPRNFAQGQGQYRVVTRYVCNPLHRLWPIIVENPPVWFEVGGEPIPPTQMPFETVPRR